MAEKDDIDARYYVWKRNTQYVYDMLVNSNVTWPSLSLCWGPVLPAGAHNPASSSSSSSSSASQGMGGGGGGGVIAGRSGVIGSGSGSGGDGGGGG
eukprot:g4028.t1